MGGNFNDAVSIAAQNSTVAARCGDIGWRTSPNAIGGGNPAKLFERSEILGVEFEPADAGTTPLPLAGSAHAQGSGCTNLYNERPAWLDNARRDIDEAVAAAYGGPPTSLRKRRWRASWRSTSNAPDRRLGLRFLDYCCFVPICADLPEAAGSASVETSHNVGRAVPPITIGNLQAKSA